MNFEQLRETLHDKARVAELGFSLLQEISRFVNDDDTEEKGRELVLRALDQRAALEKYSQVLDALVRQVGLFPYLEPATLTMRDYLAYEFHRPHGETELVFHRVQAEIYRRLMDGENVILSAPTSFGKSRIIDSIIASNTHANIAIVVPTIALIDETRRRLSIFSDFYKVVTQLAQRPAERNLFVFTAERLIAYEELPHIEFFVVDEFYKIGAPSPDDTSRTVALNQAFYRLSKGGGQFYLLGPSIKHIPEGIEEKLRCYFVPTRFATVATDLVNVFDWTDDLAKLVEVTSSLTEPTLVFCKSPKRVNDVARTLLASGIGSIATEMEDAATWVADQYHPEWVFSAALRQGIGIHHGRLPRSLAQLSVRAFNEGKLRYLLCTSTLIEGVNTRAKNVIILDHLINRRKYDFFTFNNIKGRSGRMFQHFVGRVFLFHKPPEEELPFVDFPFFTQDEETPESLLVQLDHEDLLNHSKDRLAEIHAQNVLPLDLIRQNSAIDPAAQVELAQHFEAMPTTTAQSFWWTRFPTYEQLKVLNRLLWKFFVRKPKNDVVSPDQLTVRIWGLRQNPSVRNRILEELKPGQYQAESADEAVERVLNFDRNWASFEFPRLLTAVSRIQDVVFTRRFGRSGNYRSFAARVEQLFRNPALIALEEYGLPLQIGEKIEAVISLGNELDSALEKVKNVKPEECELLSFEAEILRDVQRNL